MKAKIIPEIAQVSDHALREMIKGEVGAEFGAKPLQPQVGDWCLLRVKIIDVISDHASERVWVSTSFGNVEAYQSAIHSIEPRKPCVGDVVTWDDLPTWALEIFGIRGNDVWRAATAAGETYVDRLSDMLARPGFRIISRTSQEKNG